MSFKFLNEGQSGNIQEFTPIDTFIDPVSKIRVSNPSNLIDTDFEYGLQPTKWETVELINNTPAFFSKGGDTTIPDITGITTNAGTREITVTTAFPHNLAVGIPIRVAGTKSVTADGSYIINATPTLNTFTYLSRANQADTISIFDLYSSIITGEFFQGSQISISDAEGITTDGVGPVSALTVKTENKHGFGPNTPFYFLNLNSTISQEFEAQNTASVSFDPTNSATAQSFDGSNTLLQTPIDLSNSATTATQQDNITSTSPTNSTFTISINASNELAWSSVSVGDPLYYNVVAGGGFFQANPRGVVFIKDVSGINAAGNVATFQVSELPDGSVLPVLANTQGFFQVADQARTFAGNNVNEETQIDLTIEVGQELLFDGGNQGYEGDPESPPSNVGTVVGYTGTSMTLFTSEGVLDYYEGAMLKYNSTGAVATGVVNQATYFVTSFAPGQSSGLFTVSVAEQPGGAPINISGGSGTQTFSKIGISVDKDWIHLKNNGFSKFDMIKYSYPPGGRFSSSANSQDYYWIDSVADDGHNFKLNDTKAIIRDGSTAEKAANSIADLKDLGINTNGAYWLDPGLVENPYLSYIRFNYLDGNDWQLILKVHNRGDMTSGSAFWTNSTLQNELDMNLTSGSWSKYAAWNRVAFTRLAMEMSPGRVPPIMIFNTARTMFQACTLRNYTGGFQAIMANSTDPQLGNSVAYNTMPMKQGAPFPLQTGNERILQGWGIGNFANNSSNSTTDNAGLSSLGRAGAWVGAAGDEGGHVFGNQPNSGSDSGFGFGGGAGNQARTWSAGYGEWASAAVVNTLPGYLWVR
jgi:hypothetical protein